MSFLNKGLAKVECAYVCSEVLLFLAVKTGPFNCYYPKCPGLPLSPGLLVMSMKIKFAALSTFWVSMGLCLMKQLTLGWLAVIGEQAN